MARNFNIFQRLGNAENQIINGINLNKKNPTKKLMFAKTRQPKIAHDDYTIKMESENSEKRYNYFIDRNGKKMPIHQSCLYHGPVDDNYFEDFDGVDNSKEISEKLVSKYRKSKSRHWEEHKSIEEFFWHRPSFRNRHGVGLYKDYNPKLNAGAPGNRRERRRQAKKLAENAKWNPIIVGSYEENNIVDIVSEDANEIAKTFDMIIVILEDYYIYQKAS
jgi:hypothetical protein